MITSGLVKKLLSRLPPNSLHNASAARDWIDENARLLADAIAGFDGFDILERGFLPLFLYPRLLVYLISCAHARSPSLLPAIAQKQKEWATLDPTAQLSEHRSIQDGMWDLLSKCADYGIALRETGERIAKSDAMCISAHVLLLLGDQDRIKQFKANHSLYLQSLIDLLQLLTDFPDIGTCRPLLVRILRGLSRGSELYPSSLNLISVERNTEQYIGNGSFGEVWGGTVGNVAVAIKVMRHLKGETVELFTKAFVKEALIWKQLSHPHVLPFYGVCRQLWPQDPRVISLISPLMPRGNIVDYCTDLPLPNRLSVASILVDAASGLEYLHTLKPPVIHGDLKGTNILLTHDGRACLADFGLCTLVEDPTFSYTPTATTYTPGAWPYRSPELLEEPKPQGTKKSIASDVYAFGCVCYELCTEKTTRFSHLSLFQRYSGVMNNSRMVQPTSIRASLWNIVEACWEIRPNERPMIEEVLQALIEELTYNNFTAGPPHQWDLTIMSYVRAPTLIRPLLDRPQLEPTAEPMIFTDQDVVIALMGPTGTGKSSFINIALQQAAAEVSDSLESCTQEVCAFACFHPDRSGRRIILVDTPGFDDTYRTDWDILKAISNWLAKTYRQKIMLSGILQFHAIDERKMRGTPQRNLAMFEDLCGKDAMQNVVFISTHWDRTPENIASHREYQLMTQFWTSMTQKGSRVERFSPRTYDKAWQIIDMFSCAKTAPLTVQTEMVDENKELHETSAFRSLKRFWDSLMQKLKMPTRKNKWGKKASKGG